MVYLTISFFCFCKTLVHYSHVSLKEPRLRWLEKRGLQGPLGGVTKTQRVSQSNRVSHRFHHNSFQRCADLLARFVAGTTPEQDQHPALEASPQSWSKTDVCGYGHRIRSWVALPTVILIGVFSGAVPFSTQSRSCWKSPVGEPLAPPKQWPRPGASKYR